MKLKMFFLDWKSLEGRNNYEVAADFLKERYGRKELMINAHFSQLRDLPIGSTYCEKLSSTYDHIEQHLRSVQTLGEKTE